MVSSNANERSPATTTGPTGAVAASATTEVRCQRATGTQVPSGRAQVADGSAVDTATAPSIDHVGQAWIGGPGSAAPRSSGAPVTVRTRTLTPAAWRWAKASQVPVGSKVACHAPSPAVGGSTTTACAVAAAPSRSQVIAWSAHPRASLAASPANQQPSAAPRTPAASTTATAPRPPDASTLASRSIGIASLPQPATSTSKNVASDRVPMWPWTAVKRRSLSAAPTERTSRERRGPALP
jgi:hypothetical protein